MKIGRDSTEGKIVTVIVVGDARVVFGDCRDVLKTLADCSVDSVVTDPPYELGFMGKKWDGTGIAYDLSVWVECLRVLKPGGHVLAFGGSRTWHRMAVAIEDAGFEIRDSIAWMYGSGFPKSLDVSKAIDKAAGAKREVVSEVVRNSTFARTRADGSKIKGDQLMSGEMGVAKIANTLPATSEAQEWEGWGTALKPAFEPIVVGRKPFAKGSTVAANVLEHGVGGLNIDASRIGTDVITTQAKVAGSSFTSVGSGQGFKGVEESDHVGRWPANVILDEYSAGLLDEQNGVIKGGTWNRTAGARPFDNNGKPTDFTTTKVDNTVGGASRFFYCAKASKRDRNEGLDGLADGVTGSFEGNVAKLSGRKIGANPDKPNLPGKNFHPTVKPTSLMRYLIKLVTPAGGTVLDPFTGSGSTGKAALLDGYKFVGAELTEEYLPIIEGRLRWAYEQEADDETLF